MKRRGGRNKKKGKKRVRHLKKLKDGRIIEILSKVQIKKRMKKYKDFGFSPTSIVKILGYNFNPKFWDEMIEEECEDTYKPIEGERSHLDWKIKNRKKRDAEKEEKDAIIAGHRKIKGEVFGRYKSDLRKIEADKNRKKPKKKKSVPKKSKRGKKRRKGKGKKKKRKNKLSVKKI